MLNSQFILQIHCCILLLVVMTQILWMLFQHWGLNPPAWLPQLTLLLAQAVLMLLVSSQPCPLHLRLVRIIVVTLCLVMTASLVGSSLFFSPHWLEGHDISPGIQVISGPINMNSISSTPSLDDSLFSSLPVSNYPKCWPSRVLPECEPSPVQAGVLLSPSQPLPVGNILSGEIPGFSTTLLMMIFSSEMRRQENTK